MAQFDSAAQRVDAFIWQNDGKKQQQQQGPVHPVHGVCSTKAAWVLPQAKAADAVKSTWKRRPAQPATKQRFDGAMFESAEIVRYLRSTYLP